MSVRPRVEVHGLKDIQAKLRQLDPALAKELKDVNLTVATMVANVVQRKVPSRSGRARASVKAKGEQRFATIKAGGAKAPYYPWLDFGGSRGDEKRDSRPFVRGGRYIWPTVSDYRRVILDEYVKALGALLDKAGL